MRDPEKKLAYNHTYYQMNREKIIAQNKEWTNSENGKASRQLSEIKRQSTEKYKEYHRQWAKTPKGRLVHRAKWNRWSKTEKGRAADHRHQVKRRTLLTTIESTLTDSEWRDILIQFNNSCAYCKCLFDVMHPPTQDHRIPISKGGHHTKENVVPACKPCNSRKKDQIWQIS